jgi:glycosyltransferase A (GT-A) superfamily protein (DUF2064 family)
MKKPDLILLATQPVAGLVKPRLQPVYTAEQAAAIAAQLLRGTVAKAVDNWPGDVYLYGTPHCRHPLFDELAQEFHIRLADQGPGTPGQCMEAALRDGIARRAAAAVMVCDIPHCAPDVLEAAYEHLARGHHVIGPGMDGGCYLLGLQEAAPPLLEGVEWGGGLVMVQIMMRAEVLGVELETLPLVRDVDIPADLSAVATEYPALRAWLRATDIRSIPIVSRPMDD